MGNEYSGLIRNELTSCRKLMGHNPAQLRLLREKFMLTCDDDLSIQKPAFMDLLKLKDPEATQIFKLFDTDNSDRIDSYEFICCTALLSHSTLKVSSSLPKEKVEIMFGLFDFDNSLVLNKDELVVLSRSLICALHCMCGKKTYPSISDVEKKLNAILAKHDMAKLEEITLKELQTLCSKDPTILSFLEGFNLLHSDDIKDYVDLSSQIPECDSDLEEEVAPSQKPQPKNSTDSEKRKANFEKLELEMKKNQFTNEKKNSALGTCPPDIRMEPSFVNGFRYYDRRNNIKISSNSEIISFSGKIGWVQSRKATLSQKLFLNHTRSISCIALIEYNVITAEEGDDAMINIWDCKTRALVASIKTICKGGVKHMCASNEGRKLAVVEAHKDHTTFVYDYSKIISGKNLSETSKFSAIFKGPVQVL
jgi:Ca2+-binding EF-hand superfamily protein